MAMQKHKYLKVTPAGLMLNYQKACLEHLMIHSYNAFVVEKEFWKSPKNIFGKTPLNHFVCNWVYQVA